MEKFKTAKLYDADNQLTGRWYVFYHYRDPDSGRFVRFRIMISDKIKTKSGRRQKGHEIIRMMNQKLKNGYNPFADAEKKYKLLSATLNYIIGLKEKSCRKRTTFTYRSMVNQLLKWLEKKGMKNITVDDFNVHLAQEYMDYTLLVQKNNSRTYNNRITALRTIFNVLINREYIESNPFSKVVRLAQQEPDINFFTMEELRIMMENLPSWNYDLYVCACLIFYCFIRPQELCRLKVCDISLVNHSIRISSGVSKNKVGETLYMPLPMISIINRLDLNFPPQWFIFGTHQKRNPQESAPTRIAEQWSKFAKKFGIEKNIYALKHTGVGMAIESGINARDLQLHLRHASLEETQGYLDRFSRRPSSKLINNFPDLSRLTKKSEPGHFLQPEQNNTPFQPEKTRIRILHS